MNPSQLAHVLRAASDISGEKTFVPSLLEAPAEFVLHEKKSTRASVASGPNYSIDTIRRLKPQLKPHMM